MPRLKLVFTLQPRGYKMARARSTLNRSQATKIEHQVQCGLFGFLILELYVMIFLSFFKTLVGKEVAVELKNNVVLTGTLHSVDQYLNIKLIQVSIVQPDLYPQLTALKSCFIRGSVVRYIQIPSDHVDVELLQDAARKENAPTKASNVASRT